MKTTVKVLGITALAALGVFFTACYENFGLDTRPPPEVKEFVPVDHIIGIPTGSRPGLEIVLSGTVMPPNATNKRITWSINADGETGAVLERNRLYTESEGNVTVTAFIKNGSGEGEDYTQTFDIVISITMIPVSSISGIPDALPLGFAGDYKLEGKVNPSNALNKTIVWSLKDAGTTGASIYGDILTIESSGTVIITATVADGILSGDFTQDFAIVIPYNAVTNISGIPEEVTMGDYVLHGVVTPSEAPNDIVWSVTDAGTTGAVIVNGNTLRTTATGTVTVRAAIADGASLGEAYTKDFTITISIIAVTNITGIPSAIGRGDYELNGVVTPSGASNAIVWTVTNAGATGASVNGNILKTTAVGTVTIMAAIANGSSFGVDYTQDFTITVEKYVYAAGYYQITDGSGDRACYWKNGTLFNLNVPAGTTNSSAGEIVVVNNDFYIAGYYSNNSGVANACYWVNGELKTLPKTSTSARAYNIAVDGSTIYVFGDDGDFYIGQYDPMEFESCYWKIEGNAAAHLTIINTASIKESAATREGIGVGCFAVDNGNVYANVSYQWTVSGNWSDQQRKNYLYTNGNFTEIASFNDVLDIAVLNGTVYIAGSNDDYQPFYTVMGGSSHVLDTGSGEVYSIVVQNGSPFFYGLVYGDSTDYCYWDASGNKTVLSASGNESYTINVVAFSDDDVYISFYNGTSSGYKVVGGSFTQLSGASGADAQVSGIAVQ